MPDLILIHGALGAIDQLAPLATALESVGAVHQVELEGHGSTPSGAPYSSRGFADNVRALMTEKGIARASVFGYSMGGYVALTLAAESPALIARVATLGTKLAWSPDAAAKETSRLHAPTIRAKVPRFAEVLESRHVGSGGWEQMLEKTSAYMTALGARADLDAASIAGIQQPTRLMVGDRDNVVTIEETRDAARSMPSGQLAVLPNTPHPFEQVRISLLAAHLIEFFNAVD
ncbi:MAG TPA: alpha/beta hydrolase [Gemmatimonadaceae bacterium]|jgi:pimeloyl-ACP methyl ester carboxylesterase